MHSCDPAAAQQKPAAPTDDPPDLEDYKYPDDRQNGALPPSSPSRRTSPLQRMGRSFYAASIGASLIALILVVQLFVSLGGYEPPFFSAKQAPYDLPSQSTQPDAFVENDSLKARAGSTYLIGVGKADITGPVVELNLMGYANSSQIGTGLRQRLYSRAFIVGDPSSAADRFVYLVLDTQSGDTAIRHGILEALANLGGDYAVYTRKNVAVTGTHSHSGPAAWLNYLLPQITSLGFDKQSYQAIVDGAVLSIQRAHQNLTTGTLSTGTTTIANANINRSLYAYLANPAAERAKYTDNVDKTMTMLRFTRASDGKDIGVLTWFAVHGTSMLGNNTIITGDNKGVAASLFEKAATSISSAAPGFVAGFSQANVGDTTPNVNGAWCEDGSGLQCTLENSTCGGTNEACHGRGPYYGLNDGGTKSCYEIGTRQYNGASSIYTSIVSSGGTPISGSAIKSYHSYVDYSDFEFVLPNGTAARTCVAALGNSFAAGTSDGPGAFDFTQGDSGSSDNPFWNAVGSLISAPDAAQQACQYPKPILLNTGGAHTPYDWSPNIVDIQMLRVGQLLIVVSPGEATTMSGRRWREAIASAATSKAIVPSGTTPIVVLGGPANSYTHYIATPEEYAIQRYEGASTLYGPHTLDAYINRTVTFLPYLADTATTSPPLGPDPQINTNNSLSFITGVVLDATPSGKSFGSVLTAPNASYARGAVVKTVFQAANPRNNLHLEGTYAAIEKLSGTSTWTQVKDDSDWELLYEWKRTNFILGYSEVTISWETSSSTATGTYRVRYNGDSKPLIGSISAFTATTASFTIT